MWKAWSKRKRTSRKWLACFRRWGREGREWENIFLIHNRFVLPLFLSQSYFNCRKRPQRNIIFYDKILLFIKKKKDQKLSCKNALFHGIHGHYFKIKTKKKNSPLTQFKLDLNLKKPPSWFCIRAETWRHPSNTVMAPSQNLHPSWALQWEPADKHVQAWQRCRTWRESLNSSSSLIN